MRYRIQYNYAAVNGGESAYGLRGAARQKLIIRQLLLDLIGLRRLFDRSVRRSSGAVASYSRL